MKNKLRSHALLYLLLVMTMNARAQLVAKISVDAGKSRHVNTPVYLQIKTSVLPLTDSLQLFEIQGARRTPVPIQIVDSRYVHWILDGTTRPDSKRTYELVKSAPVKASAYMQAKDSAGAIVLREGARNLLQYNYKIVEPPAGIDTIYRRSGFIHPLWAPDGQVITNIHPEGHWHHVGIWNPWTHTSFKGKDTDFWNLHQKQGTVRFRGLAGLVQGPVEGGFYALHEHIAFTGGKEQVAMYEEWTVMAYNSGTDTSRRIWDLKSVLSCADTAGITFLQYRYGGGFGLRATAAWNATNSEVLTSEGKTRANADSTRARWIRITGRTAKGKTGILVMNAPTNYDSPQPVRVWPENNERGEIMMNYSPTKMKPWVLQYGRTYQQDYRVVVFNNDLTKEEIEEMYRDYTQPPTVNVSWSWGEAVSSR